jgi:hypothetical protein
MLISSFLIKRDPLRCFLSFISLEKVDQAQEILLNSTLGLLYRFKCVLMLKIGLLRSFKYYFLEMVENSFLEAQKSNPNFLAIEKSTNKQHIIYFVYCDCQLTTF